MNTHEIIPTERVENKILLLRKQRVMLDKDLARLYNVKPIALRQQIKRNIERFPEDFMFQITEEEADILLSQNVIPSRQSMGGYLPYAFTQEGIAMLSSVLKSRHAIIVNIQIMRTFVRMREMLSGNRDFAEKLSKLENRMDKTDKNVEVIFTAIRRLMNPPSAPQKKKIGFTSKLKSL